MDSNPQEYRSHYMSRQQSQHFYLTNQQQQINYQSFRRRNLLFNFDVISKTLLLLVLLASLIQLSVASIPCSNYEYWDSKRDMCLQCTKCDVQMIVVSPCQAHKDTNCGPMSKLEIDWSQFRATEVNRKVIYFEICLEVIIVLTCLSSSGSSNTINDRSIISTSFNS